MIVDKHPNKCISGSTTGTWTSTSCGLTQSSTSLFPSSFWSSSTLSHSGLVVLLYFSLPFILCQRGLWFNLRFMCEIYFLCIYYLQETHRALPEPPGKHRDDKRDQCGPAPRGKVQTSDLSSPYRDFAVTLWCWSFVSRARHSGRLTTGNRPHRNLTFVNLTGKQKVTSNF